MAAAAKKIAAFDPKQEILDKIGDLSTYEIAQNEVLLAIYMRPETSSGGIILTANTLKEDRYQGKVHLVLKIGSACRFVRQDEKSGVVFGIDVKVGDWIVMNPSHGWAMDINTLTESSDVKDFVPCRMCYDDAIRLRIQSPGSIY